MNNHTINKEDVVTRFKKIQSDICSGLESIDGHARFSTENWQHTEGGGGITRVISHGGVFEKGGVNFSAVEGKMPAFMAARTGDNAERFFATGVSIVIHPASPMVPIIHMNIRYFETDTGDAWFGGGIDLTPIYINDEQAKQFHRSLKDTCDRFDKNYYPKFKEWADEYFFNKHRNETRGIGGIFFDYLKPDNDHSLEDLFNFTIAVGETFLTAYTPIAESNKKLEFNSDHKNWQLIRRGRYVEFNLVYDRGTKFGLETGGRIESILMSLPEHASWIYNHTTAKGSAEEHTLNLLKKGVNWID